MFDFDNLDFTTVTTGGRGTSNEPVSVIHSHKTKKNEVIFRLSRESMDKAKLVYGDKVHVQFAANDTVCRILKSATSGAVTLSQQIKDNPNSAGLIRLTYKDSLPNLLAKESTIAGKEFKRVKYVHEKDALQFDSGSVTFKLELAESE